MKMAMALLAALAATWTVCAEDAPARRDYRIFPTNSFLQCVIDGKVLEEFPPVARLKDAVGVGGPLAGAAGEAFFRENVSYYAFALVPSDVRGLADKRQDDDEDDFGSVLFIGFSTNVTIQSLEAAVDSVMKSAWIEKGGGRKATRELLPGNMLKLTLTNGAPSKAEADGGGGENAPQSIFLACAGESLAVAASEEPLARKIADDVRAGRAFCPAVPAKHPFFWLSAEVDPETVFGDDEEEDGEEDDADEGSSLLDAMPFLRELSRITATAEGVSENESVRVVASAKFASPQGAAAAATALRPLLGILPMAGGGDALARLAARAKIDAAGDTCRMTLTFSREDIGGLIDSGAPRE